MERKTKIENQLIVGDNLQILKSIPSEYIDLIYLDPPFCTQRDFVYFNDVWKEVDIKGLEAIHKYNSTLYSYIEIIEATHSKAMKAYITYITQRMIELHRILKKTGSIYLHCDPTASHYLKQMMDCIFGRDNFRNEIVWHYKTYYGRIEKRTYYPWKHDVIFCFSKTKTNYFNGIEYQSNYQETVDYKRWKKYFKNENKIYEGSHPTSDNRFLAYRDKWIRDNGREPKDDELLYECKGDLVSDVWYIKAVDPKSKEKLGYPTQKPLALLHRIIKASSKEGDLVLDPFCGCATTCVASEQLKRKWIGIDIEAKAVEVGNARLKKIT